MLKKSQEKRIYKRYPFEATITYIKLGDIKSPPDINYSAAKISDISSGGFKLELNQASLDNGALLLIKLPLPDTTVMIPVIARVQWISKDNGKSVYVGVKFIIEN